MTTRQQGICGRFLHVACLLLVAQGVNAAARDWFTLTIDGERVGYAWRETRTFEGRSVDSVVMRVHVSQQQRLTVVESVTEVSRTASGRPEWMRVRSVSGLGRSGWTATVAADTRSMVVSPQGTGNRRTVALPAEVLWPDELPAALARRLPAAGSRARVQLVDTTTASVADLQAERIGAGTPTRINLVMTNSIGRPRMESLLLDSGSRLIGRERAFLGAQLRWEPCVRNCDAKVERPFDVMARLVIASPFRIPGTALAGPIRYVISRTDGAAPWLPATSEQSVVPDGARAVVTICSTCGEATRLAEEERRAYLAPNPWVQSDAAVVRAFASRGAGRGKPRTVMLQLVDAVRAHLIGEVDYLGYATATQALNTRSGDCTEYAVLLAAAARARGIPARIVVGLAYAGRFSGKKDVFSPHTWVQAWTGERWESFDAGLEKFDATHIALAIGDGDPRNFDADAGSTGQWRIEKLGLIK